MKVTNKKINELKKEVKKATGKKLVKQSSVKLKEKIEDIMI